MAFKKGKYCKVSLGSAKISGMGTWTLNGVNLAQLDETEFGDNWMHFSFGLGDGGTVDFNGHYDPADSTGQDALMQKNMNGADITDLKLYIDNTSYWEPCQTTGYFSPNSTSGNDSEPSHVNITSFNIGMDKAGLGTISFSAKVSGCMVLV